MKKLLVFTDLDATLIDHNTYSYEAALPAISKLKEQNFPIIFNSSKTTEEQIDLRQKLALDSPFIVENGSAVIIPGKSPWISEIQTETETVMFGLTYGEIKTALSNLKAKCGYQFQGFSDYSVEDIASITGLTLQQAQRAKTRVASEPIVWQDDESRFEEFARQLDSLNLSTTRGGRFRHIMAKTNKGKALTWLADRYRQQNPQIEWITVALGDSPNDLEMLYQANIAVLVPNPHRPPFECASFERIIRPNYTGPEGWNEAIQQILTNYCSA